MNARVPLLAACGGALALALCAVVPAVADTSTTTTQTAATTTAVTTPGSEMAAEASSVPTEVLAGLERSAPQLLAASAPASIEGMVLQPALQDGGEELVSAGTLTTSTIGKLGGGEFAVETAEGEMRLTPSGLAPAAGAAAIVDGAAAIFPSGARSTSLVVRPTALGVSASVALDSPGGPRSLRWEIGLGADEQLERLDDGDVAVVTNRLSASWQEPVLGEVPNLLVPGDSDGTSVETREAEAASGSEASPADTAPGSEAPPAAAQLATGPIAAAAGAATPQQTAAAYQTEAAALAGAEAQTGGAALMVIRAPTVTDAAGVRVRSTLVVTGNAVTLDISPTPDSSYPLIATLAVSAPSDTTSAERHRPIYGLADDRPSSFGAGLSQQLRGGPLEVEVARLVIPYDVALTGGPELERLREWLHAVGESRNALQGKTLRPYVTLWSQSCLDADGEGCTPPPRQRYREAVSALMSEYGNGNAAEGLPAVKMWGAWNEPNDDAAKFPASVAGELWQTAQSVGSSLHCACEIAAAEFAGYPSAYAAEYKDFMLAHGLRPGVWGMHDYGDLIEVPASTEAPIVDYVNARAREFVELTGTRLGKPRIWLSEQGVELKNTGGATRLLDSPELQQLAAEDFLRLGQTSTRIQLVDYYMLRSPEAFVDSATGEYHPHPEAEEAPVFDSALLSEAGGPLPALCVLGYESHECPAAE